MPTSTFAITDAGVIVCPGANFSDYPSVAGRAARVPEGNGAEIVQNITGTAADLSFYSDAANPFTVTIDGSTTTPTVTTGSWQTMTLILGLEGTHLVVIKTRAQFACYFDKNGLWSVTGVAPAVAIPTGYGAQVAFKDVTSSVSAETLATQTTNGFTGLLTTSFPEGVVRFRWSDTGQKLRLWLLANTYILVSVDGGAETKFTVSGAAFGHVDLSSIVPDGSTHEYTICSSKDGMFVYGIMGSPAGFIPSAVSASTRKRICIFGHSIAHGITGSTENSYSHKFYLAGYDVFNRGVPGTTVKGYAGGDGENRVAADVVTIPTLDYCFIDYIINDAQDLHAASETSVQMQTAMYNVCAAIHAGFPSLTKLIVVGCLPNQSGSVDLSDWNGKAAAAIASGGNGSGTTLTAPQQAKSVFTQPPVVMATWSSTYFGDDIHPNAAGYTAQYTTRLLPEVVDTIAPIVSSASVNTAGTTLTIVHSEAVTGVENAVAASDYQLTPFRQLGVPSSSDGGITWIMSCSLVIQGTTLTLRYSDGDGFVVDLASNLLLSFSGLSVTNNSTIVGGKGVYPYGCHLIGL